MYALLKQNSPFTYTFLVLLTVVLSIQSVALAQLAPISSGQVVYQYIVTFFKEILHFNSQAFAVLSSVIIFVEALWLNYIALKHKLFQGPHFFTAFSFILISFCNPSNYTFHPLLLSSIILIACLDLLFTARVKEQASKLLFNLGLLLSIACFIQFDFWIIIPFITFCLLILRPFRLKELLLYLSGLLFPLYFSFVFLYCTDQLSFFSKWAVYLPFKFSLEQINNTHLVLIIFGFLIWFVFSLFAVQNSFLKWPVYYRRLWLCFWILLIGGLILSLWDINQKGFSSFIIVVPVLSLLLNYAFLNPQFQKLNNISFYFALLLLLFCQIF